METTRLTSAEYWESEAIDLRLNPRRSVVAAGLVDFLRSDCGVRSAVVLATSGSSGEFKFAVLSRQGLLASAASVNRFCGLGGDDVWLASLSGFHVGGLGIYARAFLSRARVAVPTAGRWRRDGKFLVESIDRAGATLTSVTPTHLHDLVSHRVRCPGSIRAVFLGGGPIESSLVEDAASLGWPVRVSYGMTEASSQIATARCDETEWLPILPHWETRVEADGRLAIRGVALFSGYARRIGVGWEFENPSDRDGWFTTGDRCEIRDGCLRFLGRADDLVKVSGEFVSVSSVRRAAEQAGRRRGLSSTVCAVPDPRRGHELALVVEGGEGDAKGIFEELAQLLEGIERPARWIALAELPRTEIGKVDVAALERISREALSRNPPD